MCAEALNIAAYFALFLAPPRGPAPEQRKSMSNDERRGEGGNETKRMSRRLGARASERTSASEQVREQEGESKCECEGEGECKSDNDREGEWSEGWGVQRASERAREGEGKYAETSKYSFSRTRTLVCHTHVMILRFLRSQSKRETSSS